MDLPDVFEHADHRAFLDAWFRAKKEANPKFSHRAVARRLGTTDPSAFLHLVSGRRRFSTERVEDVIRMVGLEDDRAEYFRLLVRFGQAEDVEERDRAWAAIAELRGRSRQPEIGSAKFLYLSNRLYPVVQALAECEGFREDPAWIAAVLRPEVSEDEAVEALGLLQRLGFLVRDTAGVLRPAEPVVRTAEQVENLGSYGYHRQTHQVATQALERLWDPELELARTTAFLGLAVAVPESRLADLRRLMWEAQLHVLHQVEAWSEPKDRVVQLQLQLFPVSAPTTER